MTLKEKICSFIATLGPIGSLPMATYMGAIAAIPLLFVFRRLMFAAGIFGGRLERLVIIVLVFLAWWIIEQSYLAIRSEDASRVVIDQVIGFFVVMNSFPFVPLAIIMGFSYFLLMKTFQPFGVAYARTMPGAMGVLLDDVIAGIWAHIAMFFTLQLLGTNLF